MSETLTIPVKPHRVKSRVVTPDDMDTVRRDAEILFDLCVNGAGKLFGFEAACHAYMEGVAPLRFFVTKDKEIIINPVLIRALKTTDMYKEVCGMFPLKGYGLGERARKIEVTYQTVKLNGELGEPVTEGFKHEEAIIFQHMIDHMEGKSLWPV